MSLPDSWRRGGPRRALGLGAWALGVLGARHSAFGPRRIRVRKVIRGSAGFTLIEMLVVLVVMAVLAGVVGPMVFRNVGDAKRQAARTQIELLGMALDAYRLDNGSYPTTEQGLDALWARPAVHPAPPRWRGPYTKKQIPLDPWDRPYVYRSPGDSVPAAYDLVTLGRDGTPGGEDENADLTSWGSR